MTPEQITALIQEHFPEAQITVTGGEGKFEATVIDAQFADTGAVKRHQMVYACVRAQIADGSLHALSITAQTPAEAAA